jgi:hypothetical protein
VSRAGGLVLAARVTAVAGTAGIEAARAFGADVRIDYKRHDTTVFEQRFDWQARRKVLPRWSAAAPSERSC